MGGPRTSRALRLAQASARGRAPTLQVVRMTVTRRGFLSLLAATPLIPALAKLESIIQAPPPPEVVLPPQFHLQRFVMSFGDGSLVRPGGVVRYAAIPQRIFRP